MKIKNNAGEFVEVDDSAMVTMIVDGEEKEVPLSQVVSDAQKAAGADKKFQEAANRTKKYSEYETQAQKFQRLQDLRDALTSGEGGREDFVEFAELMGNDPKEAGKQWDAMNAQAEEHAVVDTGNTSESNEELKAVKAELAEIKAQLGQTTNWLRAEAGDKASGLIRSAAKSNRLLSDEKFSQNDDWIQSLIRDEAEKLFAADPNAVVDDKLTRTAADNVAKRFESLGVSITPRTRDEYKQERLKTVSLGPAGETRAKEEQEKIIPISADGGMEAMLKRFEAHKAEHEYAHPDQAV